jgi:hypothetical protein
MPEIDEETYYKVAIACAIAGSLAGIIFLGYSTYQCHVTTQLQRKTWEFMKERADEESLRMRIEGD